MKLFEHALDEMKLNWSSSKSRKTPEIYVELLFFEDEKLSLNENLWIFLLMSNRAQFVS